MDEENWKLLRVYPSRTSRILERRALENFARLELMAEEMRIKTVESKIWRAAYEEKERLRKRAEERQKLEISSFQKSRRDAIRWQETNTFRNYIDHIENNALMAEQPDGAILAWVRWARDKADWYDPLIEKEDEWMAGMDRNNILKTEPRITGGYGFNTFRETAVSNKSAWPLLPWYVKIRTKNRP